MRIPVPKNRLVALTLAGALLTTVVAVGLAFPIPGVTQAEHAGDDAVGAASTNGPQAAADAPTPNQDFTPAVQAQSGGEDEEHEAEERDDDHERGEEYEGDDD